MHIFCVMDMKRNDLERNKQYKAFFVENNLTA